MLVNGSPGRLRLEPRVTLLDALREYAGLTGTKKGGDHSNAPIWKTQHQDNSEPE